MATLAVQTIPDPSYEYVLTATNDTGSEGIFDNDADVQIGVDYGYGRGTPNDPAVDFTNLAKGIINAVPNGYQFRYQIWDVSLGQWSAEATETFQVGDAPEPPDSNFPSSFAFRGRFAISKQNSVLTLRGRGFITPNRKPWRNS